MAPSASQRIGTLAMEVSDFLLEKYGPDVSVGAVAIVADVIAGEDQVINPIVVSCSDPRRWLQSALLAEAAAQVEARNEERIAEAED